jgi:hypothetical protein
MTTWTKLTQPVTSWINKVVFLATGRGRWFRDPWFGSWFNSGFEWGKTTPPSDTWDVTSRPTSVWTKKVPPSSTWTK